MTKRKLRKFATVVEVPKVEYVKVRFYADAYTKKEGLFRLRRHMEQKFMAAHLDILHCHDRLPAKFRGDIKKYFRKKGGK